MTFYAGNSSIEIDCVGTIETRHLVISFYANTGVVAR